MNSSDKPTIRETLQKWNENYDNGAKLQSVYLAISISTLIIAGIVGLLNHDLGQNTLLISLVAFVVFLVNSVTWALLQSFVLIPLSKNSPTSSTEVNKETKVVSGKKSKK